MGNARTHVGVEVGDGLVARFGEALVLVADVGQHRERTEQLLEAVEAAAAGTVPPGPVIATRLAAIVANGEPGTVPSFGVVAPLEDGYLVLLHGLVSAEITGAPGVLRLSGEQAVTWVDQRVQVPVDRLSVTCREHPIKVDPMSDLRAGLVPGSGFVLTPGGGSGSRYGEGVSGGPSATHSTRASEGPADPAEATSSAHSAESPTTGDGTSAGATSTAGAGASEARAVAGGTAGMQPAETTGPEPAPTEYGAAAAAGTGDEGRLAVGNRAEPGLLAAAVAVDPVRPVATDESTEVGRAEAAARPRARSTEALVAPVGHLVSSDGVQIPLDRDYVLGREPEADPAVRSGAATPVRLTDEENMISRVHSYVDVVAGEVSLRDASSANGTYVAAPGDEAWTSVGTDPVVLAPTWSLRVGNRIFTYVATGTP